ncbi:tetratricopeptide repeat protein [Bremerella cremea]|uniref:O-linked GlcNAc transferase n=1 Tax=Blastopirellula marina TaxID=124 RepID=A0A2S8FKB2_9BACT|nr:MULTISPECIES: tetratricopeptide repeat protein [Pirellulaceae]PQO32470.1 O-linked GlcNAc transferase [Blastopirellula marina]RCS45537.1 tetratricopeptide repeat protein [Bremerella cremea]
MATDSAQRNEAGDLSGKRIAIVGKLAGMTRREVFAALREADAHPSEKVDQRVDIIVFGENDLTDLGDQGISEELQEKAAAGELQFISETTLWQWLGLIEPHQKLHRLYTPAMLSDLLGVSKSIIRRWHRRGLIVPARQVRSLPYFDYHEVASAKQLAGMLASGMSPEKIERQLSAISEYYPDVQRPLTQLSVIVQGSEILLRQGEGLLEPGGQMRFDFDRDDDFSIAFNVVDPSHDLPETAEAWESRAADYEDDEQLDEAIRCLRSALSVGGPSADRSFRLAELLYRAGHLGGAIERYYVVIEQEPEMIEARANLGCVLAETGQLVEAVSALREAIEVYDDYCDAHYHLARVLDDLGREREAKSHWEKCLALNPDSPWADEAYARLNPAEED